MKKGNQKGFGVVEALLILVAVGILGFTGWYVYHAQKTVDKNYSSANSSTVPTYKKKTYVATKSTTSASQSSTASTTVFKITELAVEVTVPNSIKDIVYKVGPDSTLSTGQKTQSVTLSTQTLTNLSSDCSVNGSAPPLGTLSKTQGQYPSSPGADTDNVSGALIKQFPTYYIAWNSPQAPCGSAASTQAAATTDTNLFSKALHSTVAPIQ